VIDESRHNISRSIACRFGHSPQPTGGEIVDTEASDEH